MRAVKLALALASIAALAPAHAFDLWRDTNLVGIKQGSELSRSVVSVKAKSFETAQGQKVYFDNWYSSNWTDANVDFMTRVSPSLGVLWGFSTGERGVKYKIDPSFKLGFVHVLDVQHNVKITTRLYQRFGGSLTEKTCIADYGDIGGVQEVNCRLAASNLPPKETLKYLLTSRPKDSSMINITLNITF